MQALRSNNIFLRALEPGDLNFLYEIENKLETWEVSNTQTPFSKHILEKYISAADQDIYSVKQLRLMICNLEGLSIGTIDLFDFDPQNKRAGVGIYLIEEARSKGYASETIQLICDYAINTLGLRQVYCGISPKNKKSIDLFEKCKFIKSGIKKDWRKSVNGNFEDEIFYQFIKN